jgi:hypothetical protein
LATIKRYSHPLKAQWLKLYVNLKTMKNSGLLYVLLALIALSCHKDNESSNFLPKPPGMYLKEIKQIHSYSPIDTFKWADFEYDDNRYLKEIRYYDPNQAVYEYNTFVYNERGQICQIELHTRDGSLGVREVFTYNDNHLVSGEVYKTSLGILKLDYRLEYETDSVGQIKNEDLYFRMLPDQTESILYSLKCSWNEQGNLYKIHLFGVNYEVIDEYKFDNMNSPCYNLGIPISNETISFFNIAYLNTSTLVYLSKNNIISHKHSYLDYSSISDTITDSYYNEVPSYGYRNNDLFSVNGEEFFYYEYLE